MSESLNSLMILATVSVALLTAAVADAPRESSAPLLQRHHPETPAPLPPPPRPARDARGGLEV